MAVHGDIREITFNHPEIGSGILSPKAGEDNTFDIGGFRNNDDESQITTAGDLMLSKSRVRGFFEVVVEDDAKTREDLEKMVDLSDSSQLAEWTVTLTDGTVYAGKGTPVGDLQKSLLTGVFTLKVAANGKWQKIN